MIRECSLCGATKVLVKSCGDFARAERCECQKICPICNNTGYLFTKDERGYSVVKPCSCTSLDRCIEWFNQAGIPGHYANATFQSFDVKGDPIKSSLRQHAYRFAQEFEIGQPGILYYGPCGTGKTHLTIAILRHLILHRGIRAKFVEFMHLLSDLRARFGELGSTDRVLEPLVQVPVLAIDELGKNRGSDWEQSILDELISKRYNAHRTTLFTTNLYPSPEQNQVSLESRVGERIYSRLREMCDARPVMGKDYRLQLSPSAKYHASSM